MKKVIALVVVCALGFAAWWLALRNSDEQQFAELYQAGDYSRLASKLDTSNPEQAFVKANCLRQLGRFEEAMQIATALPEKLPEAFKDLMETRFGQFDDSPLRRSRQLNEAGIPTDDAFEAVAWGCLEKGEDSDASRVLSTWADEDTSGSYVAQRAYLQYMIDTRSGGGERISPLVEIIARYPSYELPPIALTEILTTPPNVDLAKAKSVLEYATQGFPANAAIQLKLASVLRQSGDTAAAKKLVEGLREQAGLAEAELTRELATLAFDTGNASESIAKFTADDEAPLAAIKRMSDEAFRLNLSGNGTGSEGLSRQAKLAAVALALSGSQATAAEGFEHILDRVARTRRLVDVRAKQMLFPDLQQLRDETNLLTSPAFTPDYPTLAESQDWFAKVESAADLTLKALPGYELYASKCAACHGEQGRGDGRASRHLKRAARNFEDEPIRIVSSQNGLASNSDLSNSIRMGQVPGGMPAFPDLSDAQLTDIIAVIRQIQRSGQLKQLALQTDESPQDESASNEVNDSDSQVEARFQGDQQLASPEFPSPTPELTADGKAAFRASGCAQCHLVTSAVGETLASDNSATRLFHDSLGRPIQAPNLAVDALLGGDSPQQIYRRIKLGIPGTAHPSGRALDDATALSITTYLRSLR